MDCAALCVGDKSTDIQYSTIAGDTLHAMWSRMEAGRMEGRDQERSSSGEERQGIQSPGEPVEQPVGRLPAPDAPAVVRQVTTVDSQAEKGSGRPRRVTKADEFGLKVHIAVLLITGFFKITKLAFICGTIIFVSWIAGDAIKSLAGKATAVEAALDVAGKVSADRWIAWVAIVILSMGWRRTYSSKKRLAKEAANRFAKHELEIDPDRTSSGLDEQGCSPVDAI